MPKQVLPTAGDITTIQLELERRGFRAITSKEVRRNLARLRLQSPRRRRGKELGFRFDANGLTVVVWTTWLLDENRIREEDSGWVLILDGDEAVYFATPTYRTKNFVDHLLRRAWIAWWRANHRPYCPHCREWMKIAQGKHLKSRYWRCNNVSAHPDGAPVTRDWDRAVGLPPKASTSVKKARKRRKRQRDETRAKGGRPFGSMLTRRSW